MKRILIMSDNHRQLGNVQEAIEREQPIDLLIHLGDVEGTEDFIRETAGCPCEIVSGNNDFFSKLPREKEIEIDGLYVLLTHGHSYGVSMGSEYIMQEARDSGFDIVMYGHTHKPCVEEEDGVIGINPGSICYPRQENRRPSYIMMETDEEGNAEFDIRYL